MKSEMVIVRCSNHWYVETVPSHPGRQIRGPFFSEDEARWHIASERVRAMREEAMA